jgi:hypothetical protein
VRGLGFSWRTPQVAGTTGRVLSEIRLDENCLEICNKGISALFVVQQSRLSQGK